LLCQGKRIVKVEPSAAAEQLAREDPTFASLAERLAALLGLTARQDYPARDFTLARIDHSAPAN
jgi:hypothetical protein